MVIRSASGPRGSASDHHDLRFASTDPLDAMAYVTRHLLIRGLRATSAANSFERPRRMEIDNSIWSASEARRFFRSFRQSSQNDMAQAAFVHYRETLLSLIHFHRVRMTNRRGRSTRLARQRGIRTLERSTLSAGDRLARAFGTERASAIVC